MKRYLSETCLYVLDIHSHPMCLDSSFNTFLVACNFHVDAVRRDHTTLKCRQRVSSNI